MRKLLFVCALLVFCGIGCTKLQGERTLDATAAVVDCLPQCAACVQCTADAVRKLQTEQSALQACPSKPLQQ